VAQLSRLTDLTAADLTMASGRLAVYFYEEVRWRIPPNG
jgi:hypothetical protein